MIGKLDLYRVYCVVCEQRSFSKAAKELYMTQPAVSQSIAQLEKDLNVSLFIRTSKGVNLTNESQILYEYVNSAINLISSGEEKLLELKNLTNGYLKIGVGDTVSKYLMVPYLEKFHKDYPNIKFKIVNGTTMELCSILKSGKIDMAICNMPIEDPAFETKNIMEIQDTFVCGEKYNEKIKKELDFKELADFPLILLESQSNSRQYVEKFMLSKGVKIVPEIELGSHDLLLEFAKIDLGLACVTKEFSREYLTKGILYEVKTKKSIPKRHIGICYLKSVPLSIASQKFMETLKNK